MLPNTTRENMWQAADELLANRVADIIRNPDDADRSIASILPSPRKPDLPENPVFGNDRRLSTEHHQLQDGPRDLSPLYRRARTTWRRFNLLQQWECVVSEVGGDSIYAELRDMTEPGSNSLELVEVPLAEISDADIPLLQCGAVFYWSIGLETSPGGQVRRISEIRARRNPKWSEQAIASIKAQAEDYFRRMTNDED